jgi:putative isomerase
MKPYDEIQQQLARGWNTWNTRSVLSHALLPQGFALNLCIREYWHHRYLKEALIGRKDPQDEQVRPGPHAYDGSYTELTLGWEGNEFLIQSAKEGEELVILVTPRQFRPDLKRPPLLVIEGGILWNRPGYVILGENGLIGRFPDEGEGEIEIPVYATHANENDPHVWTQTPYLSMKLSEPVGISTGRPRSAQEIHDIIKRQAQVFNQQFAKFGDLEQVYRAVQAAMAWDTIYEPEKRRVVSPVSRIWNVNWGGYVLFEWDNYFAAYMASLDNRELAYANAVEMTREITERGLVPNFATANGVSSRDRSEPPVGALVCRELYRRYQEGWFLEEVFSSLLRWNRWWHENRDLDGLLCWGSDPYEPVNGAEWEGNCVNTRQGGAWESGLDNLPLFDDIPFNPKTHLLMLQEVGLTSLYVADCEALADIAGVMGKRVEEGELRGRAAHYRDQLGRLWSEERGIYLCRRLDTGMLEDRLALTNFYPLLAKAPTPKQAERMIREHFYNPEEFWGEWIIPNTPRNDPAYQDQHYWRGRIWGPTNFLVYLVLV